MKKLITTILIFVTTSVTLTLLAQTDVKVIVNNSNSTTSIKKASLSNIFLKKVSKFPNGMAAQPVDQSASSPTRIAFTKAYLGKSISSVKNYWNQQLFSGADVPPLEKASDAEVVDFVKSNQGAIGYVSAAADISGVKEISVE